LATNTVPPTPTAPLTGPHDLVEAAGHPAGAGLVKEGYDDRLTNEDLAPLRRQTWGGYNFFAFWMSDVHSVGGYVTAGSLFALGIASWQVLISLIVGILIVMVFANLVAKPSQKTGVPFPVINRAVFGVIGANIPAIIRGLIAMAWYGVQTFLAAQSLNIIFLKFVPGSAGLLDHSFLGLDALGWISYGVLWVAQAALFWRGMDTIRKFIDFAGPAVYVIMIALAIYLVAKAGWGDISLTLSVGKPLSFAAAIPVMISAVAIVVSYFSGPMLNFGDFSRYGRSFRAVKRGNLLGLPLNFLFFSILTVLCASATVPVFGKLITDPIETVQAIGAPFAILLGGLTFVTATVGINIVANFISPAFDFSNVAPRRISWRMGGMIAAVGSVLLTPWNWYSNPQAIQYTLGVLGALIGPLFGLLIAGYYLVGKQRVAVDDLFTMSPTGRYWYRRGFNPNAVWTMVVAGAISVGAALVPTIVADAGGPDVTWLGNYGWFIGCALGLGIFWALETVSPRMPALRADDPTVSDGTLDEADEAAAILPVRAGHTA
jgi:NCS1 family nucleobase:cation symporter-1